MFQGTEDKELLDVLFEICRSLSVNSQIMGFLSLVPNRGPTSKSLIVEKLIKMTKYPPPPFYYQISLIVGLQ